MDGWMNSWLNKWVHRWMDEHGFLFIFRSVWFEEQLRMDRSFRWSHNWSLEKSTSTGGLQGVCVCVCFGKVRAMFYTKLLRTLTTDICMCVFQDHADLSTHSFRAGMKLEMVSPSEPFHICPVSVTKVRFHTHTRWRVIMLEVIITSQLPWHQSLSVSHMSLCSTGL